MENYEPRSPASMQSEMVEMTSRSRNPDNLFVRGSCLPVVSAGSAGWVQRSGNRDTQVSLSPSETWTTNRLPECASSLRRRL